MKYKTIEMGLNKKIALVAHDNKKRDLIEWAKYNRDLLAHHKCYATGTTGAVLEKELKFPIACDRSSADFIISSPLMDSTYLRIVPDYAEYRTRPIPGDPIIMPVPAK